MNDDYPPPASPFPLELRLQLLSQGGEKSIWGGGICAGALSRNDTQLFPYGATAAA
jgi:hypothetical protein